jgi:hypothetical protein
MDLKSLFVLLGREGGRERISCFDLYVSNCNGKNALMDSACEDKLCDMVEEI